MPRRPSTYAPGNETRLRLAQAAAELVLERGTFDGLSGPEIERQAGKGRGIMRYHWPDIVQLKLAIGGHHGDDWLREMEALADQARSCRSLMEAVGVVANGVWSGPSSGSSSDHARMIRAIDMDPTTRVMIDGWALLAAQWVWFAVSKHSRNERGARIVAQSWIWSYLGAVRSDTPYDDWIIGALGVASILDVR